jgi:thioredoxin reductase (NADPH)
MVHRARSNPKIDFVTPYVVDEILGETAVTGVRLRHVDTGETREIDAAGFFVAIGHDPNTRLFMDQLDHDENGYLVTKPGTTETNIPGVFAVGDVQDHVYRQAVTAAGSGCMGALDAERYLAQLEGHAGTALTAPRPEAEPAHAQA